MIEWSNDKKRGKELRLVIVLNKLTNMIDQKQWFEYGHVRWSIYPIRTTIMVDAIQRHAPLKDKHRC